MGKKIRLTETELTRIIADLVREETEKRKGRKEGPTSRKDLKKLSKKDCKKLMKCMNMDSMDSIMKGYSKMYNESPKWAKGKSLTPSEFKMRMGDLPPDEDPKPAACIILAIFSWTIAAWAFATWCGWEHSDSRLKENINRTGISKSGIPIYTFNYKNDDTLWSGAMAQDLLNMGMENVVKTMDNGYYSVNYNMIDVDMTSL